MGYSKKKTAVILIGFQNDYFAPNGTLHLVIDESSRENNTLQNTLKFIKESIKNEITIYNIPIYFSEDYCELNEPIGLLAQIKDLGAFKKNTKGGQVIPEILAFGDAIIEIDGKTGFNSFSKTKLQKLLDDANIKNIVIAGVVTSICIDSSARAAFELGYSVTILSDCIAGRSNMENRFYCEDIFPLYAYVKTSEEFLRELEDD